MDIEGSIDQYKHMSVRTTGSDQALSFSDGKAVQKTRERGRVANPLYLDLRYGN